MAEANSSKTRAAIGRAKASNRFASWLPGASCLASAPRRSKASPDRFSAAIAEANLETSLGELEELGQGGRTVKSVGTPKIRAVLEWDASLSASGVLVVIPHGSIRYCRLQGIGKSRRSLDNKAAAWADVEVEPKLGKSSKSPKFFPSASSLLSNSQSASPKWLQASRACNNCNILHLYTIYSTVVNHGSNLHKPMVSVSLDHPSPEESSFVLLSR